MRRFSGPGLEPGLHAAVYCPVRAILATAISGIIQKTDTAIGRAYLVTHPNAPPARSAAIFSGGSSRTSVRTRSVSAPNAGAGPVLRPKLACQGNAGNTPLPC